MIATVAGNGNDSTPRPSGDGGPATKTGLWAPSGIALGPDEASTSSRPEGVKRVRRIAPDGIISTVAGNDIQLHSGDGDLATNASLDSPRGLALGPDGSLDIAEKYRIRRVRPDGIINTIAGNGTIGAQSSSSDGSCNVGWGSDRQMSQSVLTAASISQSGTAFGGSALTVSLALWWAMAPSPMDNMATTAPRSKRCFLAEQRDCRPRRQPLYC